MAQLVLTLAGSAVGGLVGGGFGQGIGALVGAYVGGMIEQELFARREVVRNDGARILEFQLSGSAYGQVIPHVFGRAACRQYHLDAWHPRGAGGRAPGGRWWRQGRRRKPSDRRDRHVEPANVRPIHLEATGALSLNEA